LIGGSSEDKQNEGKTDDGSPNKKNKKAETEQDGDMDDEEAER